MEDTLEIRKVVAASLFRSLQSEEGVKTQMEAMGQQAVAYVASQGMTDPKTQEVVRLASTTVVTYEEQVAFFSDLMAKLWTVDELEQLAEWYQSPLGKKAIAIMPQVMQAANAYIMPKVQTNIEAALKTLGQK